MYTFSLILQRAVCSPLSVRCSVIEMTAIIIFMMMMMTMTMMMMITIIIFSLARENVALKN